MANIFNLLKPEAKLPRNGFDLSQRHIFSSVPGLLTPILALECVPGDHHEINVLQLVRTTPVNTDAFTRMKQHFEFYFVPYSQIWSDFDDFISQRSNVMTASALASPFHDLSMCPYISLYDLLRHAHNVLVNNTDFSFSLNQFLRILDLLGYGAFYGLPWDQSYNDFLAALNLPFYNDTKVNLFRLCAYHKIFFDYYRNKYYDLNCSVTLPTQTIANRVDYAYGFNLDDAVNTSSHLLTGRSDLRMAPLFQTHWRQWKKDLFTGLMPDTQLGAVSVVSLTSDFHLSSVPLSSDKNFVRVNSSGKVGTGTDSVSSPAFVERTFNSDAGISVLELIKAQALQKWRQRAMLAGSSINDSYRAHYGVTPKFYQDRTCQFVGAFDSYIGLEEVTQTSPNSDGSGLGEIGAKGVGSANGKIRFDCSDFGVLMCIYSVLPEADYNALGLDKNNQLIEHFDFFTPEFENLGMEPVVYSEHYLPSLSGISNYNPNLVLGYAPRYYNYKTAIDKIHGQFMSVIDSSGTNVFTGVFSHWATPRQLRYSNISPIRLQDYYVLPDAMKNVFVLSGDTHSPQEYDTFLINCNFDVKSIRNMSVLGLPSFNS